MDAFPAFFPLARRTVVIAGSGEAAEAKARLFDGSPARLRRLDPEEALEASAYAGAVLAFIALPGDKAVEAAEAAREAGVPVNVVDRPELCDFNTPSIVDRGSVVGAIGTAGAAPVLATLLRVELETQWPSDLGGRAELARALQPALRERMPDARVRRAYLRELLRRPLQTEDEARASLDAWTPAPGRVVELDAGGPPENLRVRDLRTMAQADLLVAEPGCDPAVLAFVRRDARRAEVIEPSRAEELAAAGEIVLVCRARPTR